MPHDANNTWFTLVRDLNATYRSERALHAFDHRPEGFEWLDCSDAASTTLSYLRWPPGWKDVVTGSGGGASTDGPGSFGGHCCGFPFRSDPSAFCHQVGHSAGVGAMQ